MQIAVPTRGDDRLQSAVCFVVFGELVGRVRI
jgi:hypothetical protein